MGLALTSKNEQHYIGYVGSFLSHSTASRSFVKDGFPFTIVLEDDQLFHPDFNDVVRDIAVRAGGCFDVVNLGPLDWRYRTLEYAQKRKVMTLTVPVLEPAALRSQEELFMDGVLERTPRLFPETKYFLYWIGSQHSDPESCGSAGAWGYMVSRAGSQKLARHMSIMWESFDDQMQAVLQGADVFTETVGQRRFWAVFPPLVTSDGTWPSANVGDDLTQGRQSEPVSPHASFRDRTLMHPMAAVILGKAPAEVEADHGKKTNLIYRGQNSYTPSVATDGALTSKTLLKVNAMALVWPPVGSDWVSQPTGWQSLFEYRRGSNNEIQKELQIQIYLRPELLAFATESLTYAWTIIAALRHISIGNPEQLRVLVVHPGKSECFCPHSIFRDLAALAPSVHIIFTGPEAQAAPAEAESLDCFRVPEDGNLQVERIFGTLAHAMSLEPHIAVAFGASATAWCGPLLDLVRRGVPVVATSRSRAGIVRGLQTIRANGANTTVRFAGRNAFGSLLGLEVQEKLSYGGADPPPLLGAFPDERDQVLLEAQSSESTDPNYIMEDASEAVPWRPPTAFWIGLR